MRKFRNRLSFINQLIFSIIFLAVVSCQSVPQAEEISSRSENQFRNGQESRTFILVHGAWHPEECWKNVKQKLEQKGHVVKTIQLPGLGKDNTPLDQITLAMHVEAVKNVLAATDGKVVLVGHSYGGVVITQAGEEMPHKIDKLVYLTAFMLKNGESLADIALKDTLSVVTQNLIFNGPSVSIPSDKYRAAFYNETLENNSSKEEQDVQFVISLLKPHPIATIVTPVHTGVNYAGLSKVYIACEKDHAITINAQKYMYSRFPETTVYTLNSDHSAFITDDNQLSNLLDKI